MLRGLGVLLLLCPAQVEKIVVEGVRRLDPQPQLRLCMRIILVTTRFRFGFLLRSRIRIRIAFKKTNPKPPIMADVDWLRQSAKRDEGGVGQRPHPTRESDFEAPRQNGASASTQSPKHSRDRPSCTTALARRNEPPRAATSGYKPPRVATNRHELTSGHELTSATG